MKQETILKKLDEVDRLINEIRIEFSSTETKSASKTESSVKASPPTSWTVEQLKKDYDTLYEQVGRGNRVEVYSYIESKKQQYLTQFCKANNLVVKSKASKKKIAEIVIQSMVVRKAITKESWPGLSNERHPDTQLNL